jgi:hypothetical protein
MQNFVCCELQSHTLGDWEMEADIKMELSDTGFVDGKSVELANV